MERTKEYSVVNDTLKALKNQGLSERYFQKGHSFSSPVPKRLLWKRAGQSWSVCPRIFGGVKPFSSGQNPKNGDSTNQIGNARFGEIWHTFLEKCKISCKIIEGRYSG